jgi:hypothetical protein
MKTRFVAIVLLCLCTVGLSAEDIPRTHKFQLWGTLSAEVDKITFFIGFTNGLLASGVGDLECNGNQPTKRPTYEAFCSAKN